MLISIKNCLMRYWRNKISERINKKVEVIVILKVIGKRVILAMNKDKANLFKIMR
jgi:hypothetical protein